MARRRTDNERPSTADGLEGTERHKALSRRELLEGLRGIYSDEVRELIDPIVSAGGMDHAMLRDVLTYEAGAALIEDDRDHFGRMVRNLRMVIDSMGVQSDVNEVAVMVPTVLRVIEGGRAGVDYDKDLVHGAEGA